MSREAREEIWAEYRHKLKREVATEETVASGRPPRGIPPVHLRSRGLSLRQARHKGLVLFHCNLKKVRYR